MKICPNCGAQLPDNARFCDKCGYSMQADNRYNPGPAKKKQQKRSFRGILLIAGIVAALALIAVLAVVLLKGGSGKKKSGTSSVNAAFYLKDNQMYFTPLKPDKGMQVTKRLFQEDSDTYGGQAIVTKDLKKVFYLDRIDNGSNTFYVRDLKEDSEPYKIDSNVSSIRVLKDGAGVYYLDEEDTLYYHDLKEKTRIAREVSDFSVTDDGKYLYYRDYDNNVYTVKQGEDREKLDRDVTNIYYVKDNQQFVYLKEGSLYRKQTGEDSEKIASDVSSVVRVFTEKEIYYLREKTSTVKLSTFVNDDFASQDAGITEPAWPDYPVYPEYEYVEYPEYPDYPSRYDFDSRDEYEEAKEKYDAECARIEEEYEKACEEAEKRYEEAYAAVEKQYEDAVSKYYADYEVYSQKVNRDYLRESLDQNTYETTSRELYYYNGEETVCLTKNYKGGARSSSSSDAPVLIYTAADGERELPKVKLSELTYAGEVYDKLDELGEQESLYFIANKGETAEINLEKVSSLTFSNDGKYIWYLQDVRPEKNYGDLMKASVDGVTIGTPELVQEEVYTSFRFDPDGRIMTFAEVKNGEGELYLDGQKIDEDVYLWGVNFDSGNIYYYTDYSDSKNRGTLKIWNGKEAVEINDDVHEFRPAGDGVLILTDYSEKRGEGELFFVKGGKSEKIDDEVQRIFYFSIAP